MKEVKKIRVETLPNGYSLTFDGMQQSGGYLYFNTVDLVRGIMLHIGLEMTSTINMDAIDGFVTAVTNWNETEKCVAEIQRLNGVVEHKDCKIRQLVQRINKERNKQVNMYNGFSKAIASNEDESIKSVLTKYADIKPLSDKEMRVMLEDSVTESEEEETEE